MATGNKNIQYKQYKMKEILIRANPIKTTQKL